MLGVVAQEGPGVAAAVAKDGAELAKDAAVKADEVIEDIADGPDQAPANPD